MVLSIFVIVRPQEEDSLVHIFSLKSETSNLLILPEDPEENTYACELVRSPQNFSSTNKEKWQLDNWCLKWFEQFLIPFFSYNPKPIQISLCAPGEIKYFILLLFIFPIPRGRSNLFVPILKEVADIINSFHWWLCPKM